MKTLDIHPFHDSKKRAGSISMFPFDEARQAKANRTTAKIVFFFTNMFENDHNVCLDNAIEETDSFPDQLGRVDRMRTANFIQLKTRHTSRNKKETHSNSL